jgi:hypothetical protein
MLYWGLDVFPSWKKFYDDNTIYIKNFKKDMLVCCRKDKGFIGRISEYTERGYRYIVIKDVGGRHKGDEYVISRLHANKDWKKMKVKEATLEVL